ncbi:MAG: hypothetical protein U0133_12030 [Gemmatimonadales bacterium]
MIGRGAAVLVLSLLGGVLPLRAERGPDPHPAPEPVLLELELGRLATRTVNAFRAGETPLVPFTAFLELSELAVLRRPGGVLETLVQPGNLPLSLDPVTRVLKLGHEKRTLADTQMVALDGEVYVATTVLAQIFNLEWGVSWSDLEVVVLDPSTLPLARRLRRESFLKSRLLQSQETELTGMRLGLERQGVKGLVFDYSVLTPTTSMVKGGAYSTTLGLDVLGGSFSAGLQSQNGATRAPRADVSWTGIWRESHYLAQVQLGDGISSGPRSRTLRGVSLSNAPFARPSLLGNVPFGGQLGPGWTVEAYRGGRLIGFDSVNALGQFSFDVPVQYGENPVDFVAYGPFGELREFNRTYRVRTEGLPAGRLEYGLSAGECRTVRCSATGNLDLRYGITNRWTARAGVDQFWRDSLGNLSHPYVGVIGNVGNAFLVEGEAVGDAVLRGVGRFEPSLNLQLQVEANRYARGVRDPILTPEGRLSQYTLSAFFRPVSRLGATYLEGSVDQIHGTLNDLTSARLGASLQVSDLRLLPSVRFETTRGQGASATRTYYGVNSFMLPRPSLGPVLGKLSARTTFEMEAGAGASSASGYIGMPILRGLRTETGLSWFKGMKGPTFSLLIAAELPSVRSYTTVSAGGGNPALGTQYVQGSAVYNASNGAVDFEAGPSVQRSGVSGRVFLDANQNGRYDKGDTPLAGVRVVVGPVFATSDSSGNYSVWDLLPYEPTPVTVDSASIPSPLWVPAFNAALVEPSPNRFRNVDVPVLPGGAVEGMVRWGDLPGADSAAADSLGPRSVAGVVLVLKHKASGEQRVVTTFTDGGFYVMGLRPGEWEVTVDQRCLGLLHAKVELARFSIRPLADGDAVNGLNLTLRSE